MRLRPELWSLAVAAGLVTVSLSCLYGEEADLEKSGENLWDISKNHLKDPFRWPSVWRSTPQASDPGHMQEWKNIREDEKNSATPQGEEPAKPKNDWRASEEKRTRIYLQKMEPLQPIASRPMPTESESMPPASATPAGPSKHYLAQAVLLTTPFLGEPGEHGKIFPRECDLRYSSSNESEILQLFDEVVLSVGQEMGVKVGDLFRTYEVGGSYRAYSSGRPLGQIVETNGIVEVIRVGARSSAARLVKCFGTISRNTRACPLEQTPEVVATGYSPVPDIKLSAQVVWVTQQQQFPQPYSYAIIDRGSRRGYHVGDMILFFNRASGHMTDKVLGNGLVVSVHEESATILIQDLYPGIINRGDYSVVIQTPVL